MTLHSTLSKSSLIALSALTASTAFAMLGDSLPTDPDAKLRLGAHVSYQYDAHQGNNGVGFAPQGFYDNNRWYIEGGEIGAYPYKTNVHHVRVGISHDGQNFDPKDAPAQFHELDERKASAQALVSYMHVNPKIGGLKVKVATDALGRHHGTTVTLSHISRFSKDALTVYPSFGVTWQDKKYNNYYYGISTQESARTTLDAYQAKSGFSPFVSAMATYDLSQNFELFAHQRIDWLSSTQKQSPLTDGSLDSTTRLGINYKFK